MTKPNYFIVVGRMHGDDEASAYVIEAPTYFAAVEGFHRQIIEDSGGTYDSDGDDLPDDGPGAVYTDHIFDCGNIRPREC